jgi:hypothetical protein
LRVEENRALGFGLWDARSWGRLPPDPGLQTPDCWCSSVILSAGNLGVSFGADEIFSGLTFNIDRGDRTALVGVNGAGKTTLFRVLCGELQPSEGNVGTARGIRIGYLPQEMSEFPTGPLLNRVMLHSKEIADALERGGLVLGAPRPGRNRPCPRSLRRPYPGVPRGAAARRAGLQAVRFRKAP